MKGTKTEVRPGVWRLRVYVGRRANGTPIQRTQTFVSAEAAKRGDKCPPGAGVRQADAALASMIARANKGAAITGSETLNDLLDRFLEFRTNGARPLSPTTLRAYTSLAEVWVRPELGNVRLSQLSSERLDRLYTKMTRAGKSPATVRRAHALISSALVQGRKWKLIETNIARDASPPSPEEVRFDVPQPQQVRAILAAAEELEPNLAALLFLAAVTGARRGELCGLRWSDVDWEGRTLTVNRSIHTVRGGNGWGVKSPKSRQVRRIGLDESALAALRQVEKARDELAAELDLEPLPDGYIFTRSPVGAEPVGPDVVTRFAKRAAAKAGVDTHLHALRHFSATQAIAAGFDPVAVAGRLGHSDPNVTLRVYSHALEQRDRELAEALGRTLALPSSTAEEKVRRMIDPDAPDWERKLLEAEGVESLDDIDDGVRSAIYERDRTEWWRVADDRAQEDRREYEAAHPSRENRPGWNIENPCTHCRVSPSRNKRKPGLCAACNQFRRRNGRLPTEDEIWLRVQRLDPA
ncbi:MAG: tyrosine-type recombinase/integrase [Acidimicrobiales bacterium]